MLKGGIANICAENFPLVDGVPSDQVCTRANTGSRDSHRRRSIFCMHLSVRKIFYNGGSQSTNQHTQDLVTHPPIDMSRPLGPTVSLFILSLGSNSTNTAVFLFVCLFVCLSVPTVVQLGPNPFCNLI